MVIVFFFSVLKPFSPRLQRYSFFQLRMVLALTFRSVVHPDPFLCDPRGEGWGPFSFPREQQIVFRTICEKTVFSH